MNNCPICAFFLEKQYTSDKIEKANRILFFKIIEGQVSNEYVTSGIPDINSNYFKVFCEDFTFTTVDLLQHKDVCLEKTVFKPIINSETISHHPPLSLPQGVQKSELIKESKLLAAFHIYSKLKQTSEEELKRTDLLSLIKCLKELDSVNNLN